MKKNCLYIIISLFFTVFFSACSDNIDSDNNINAKQTVQFNVDLPKFAELRALNEDLQQKINENAITDLYLMVFTQDHGFVECVKATDLDISSNTYRATLTKSAVPRIVHFIANYDCSEYINNKQSYIGIDDRQIIPALTTANSNPTNMIMWSTQTAAINGTNPFNRVTMLRNMVKYSLNIVGNAINSLTDVSYYVFNVPDKGTLAPFDPISKTFPDLTGDLVKQQGLNFTTIPAGAADFYPAAETGFNWIPANVNGTGGRFAYSYEQNNKQRSKIVFIILKAKYNNSPNYSYYKIDIVNENKQRLDIIRNTHFKVIISNVFKEGKSTFAAALSGDNDNNTALAPTILPFLQFSDGKGLIKVDETFLIFATINEQTTGVNYYPNWASTITANDKIVMTYEDNYNILLSPPTLSSAGNLNIKCKNATGAEMLRAYITLNVVDPVNYPPTGETGLTRRITVLMAKPFNWVLGASTYSVPKTRNAVLPLKFKLPDSYPDEMLPVWVTISTNNFYSSGPVELGVENGKTVYRYLVRDKTMQTVNFYSNKTNSAETIKFTTVPVAGATVGNTTYKGLNEANITITNP